MGVRHAAGDREASSNVDATPSSARRPAPHGPGSFVMPCATLVSDVIQNRGGEELGKLEHVMLDVPSGRVAYGVLARGGVLGLGAKLFTIPWEAFTLDEQRGCLVLDIDRERLDEAPGFDHEHWPAMGDPSWASLVHEYFSPRRRS